jgi:hypothetical protein
MYRAQNMVQSWKKKTDFARKLPLWISLHIGTIISRF